MRVVPASVFLILLIVSSITPIQGYTGEKRDFTAYADLVITGNVTWVDQDIVVEGNLIVSANSSLTLINTTVTMTLSYDGSYNIYVEENASLRILDASLVTSNNDYYEYSIYVRRNATLIVRNSTLDECGSRYTKPGVIADPGAAAVIIEDSNITGTNAVYYGSHAPLEIYNTEIHGYFSSDTVPVFSAEYPVLVKIINVTVYSAYTGQLASIKNAGDNPVVIDNVAANGLQRIASIYNSSNVVIRGINASGIEYFVSLNYESNVSVYNAYLYNCRYDVYASFISVSGSSSLLIKDSVFRGIQTPISLYGEEMRLVNTTMMIVKGKITVAGIRAALSIIGSTINSSDTGAYLIKTAPETNLYIEDTVLEHPYLPLHIYRSPGATIRDSVVNGGILVTGTAPEDFIHTIVNVTSSGKPVLYMENAANTVIKGGDKYSEIIIGNSTNITLTGLTLGSGGAAAIVAGYSTVYVKNTSIAGAYIYGVYGSGSGITLNHTEISLSESITIPGAYKAAGLLLSDTGLEASHIVISGGVTGIDADGVPLNKPLIHVTNSLINGTVERGIDATSTTLALYNDTITHTGAEAIYASSSEVYVSWTHIEYTGATAIYATSASYFRLIVSSTTISHVSGDGIYSSGDTSLLYVNITDVDGYGVRLTGTGKIYYTVVSGVREAIYVSGYGFEIGNCILNASDAGIHLYTGYESVIKNNVLIGASIYIEGDYLKYYRHIIENNTVNGKPIVYLRSASNIYVDGAGELIVVDSKNITATSFLTGHSGPIVIAANSSNVIVRDSIHTSTSDTYGSIYVHLGSDLVLENTTLIGSPVLTEYTAVYVEKDSRLRMNLVNITGAVRQGVYVNHADLGVKNSFIHASYASIYFYYSEKISIESTILHGEGSGSYGVQGAGGVLLIDNVSISNAYYGIYIYSMDAARISNTTIYTPGTGYVVTVYNSEELRVENLWILGGYATGFSVSSTEHVYMDNVVIKGGGSTGIRVSSSAAAINNSLIEGASTGLYATSEYGDNGLLVENTVVNASTGIKLVGSYTPLLANVTVYSSTTALSSESSSSFILVNSSLIGSGSGKGVIYYGGRDSWIYRSRITGFEYGVYTTASSGVLTITCSEITGNPGYGVYVYAAQLVEIHNSNISGNGLHGVYIYSSGIVNATNNYWGSPTGPEYNATGDPVDPEEVYNKSGTVYYTPFLATPPHPSIGSLWANITSPANASLLSGLVDVNLTGTSGATAYLVIDGNVYWSGLLNATVQWDTMWSRDGWVTVELWVIGGCGGRAVDTKIYYVDNTAPTTRILSPGPGDYVRGYVAVKIYVSDDNLERAELRIDGNTVMTYSSTGTYTYNWNTFLETDGAHTIELYAVDEAGQDSSESITVTVDNTAPTVSIDHPANNSYVTGTVNVTVTSSDDYFAYTLLYINDTLLANITSPGTTNVTWNTTGWSDGVYIVRAVAYDYAGNTGETYIVVAVDNTPPTAAILSPPDNSTVSGTVNITVYADDANFYRVEIYINNTLVYTSTTPGKHTYQWNTMEWGNGKYIIKTIVYDRANHTATDTATVYVANQTPPPITEPIAMQAAIIIAIIATLIYIKKKSH